MSSLKDEKKMNIRILLENLTTPQSEFYTTDSDTIDNIQKILNSQITSDMKKSRIVEHFFAFIPTQYDELFTDKDEEIFDENFTLDEFIELFEQVEAEKQQREKEAAASIRVAPRPITGNIGKELPGKGLHNRRGGRNKKSKKAKKSKKSKKSKKTKKIRRINKTV